MKVVINTCYGGYSLSADAVEAFAERKGIKINWFHSRLGRTPAFVPITPEEAREGNKLVDGVVEMPVPIVGDDPEVDDAWFGTRPEPRHDPDLVAVVEELGENANGAYAQLKVVEIPDGVEYTIQEYDGMEWVAEKHRTWS